MYKVIDLPRSSITKLILPCMRDNKKYDIFIPKNTTNCNIAFFGKVISFEDESILKQKDHRIMISNFNIEGSNK